MTTEARPKRKRRESKYYLEYLENGSADWKSCTNNDEEYGTAREADKVAREFCADRESDLETSFRMKRLVKTFKLQTVQKTLFTETPL